STGVLARPPRAVTVAFLPTNAWVVAVLTAVTFETPPPPVAPKAPAPAEATSCPPLPAASATLPPAWTVAPSPVDASGISVRVWTAAEPARPTVSATPMPAASDWTDSGESASTTTLPPAPRTTDGATYALTMRVTTWASAAAPTPTVPRRPSAPAPACTPVSS